VEVAGGPSVKGKSGQSEIGRADHNDGS